MQPLTESYLSRLQVLVITSLHLSVNRHHWRSFTFLSGSDNTKQTSLIRLHFKWGAVEKIIKKHTVTTLKGFSHFQNNTLSQIFFCYFFITQVQVKLIEVSCFTSTIVPILRTPFEWPFFDISFHAWSTFEIHHLLYNALKIIIWNRITKTLIKIVDNGSEFITFVTFAIFCVVRKMEIY